MISHSLDIETDDIFVFVRENGAERVLAVLNFSGEERSVTLPFKKASVICNTYLNREFGKKTDLKDFRLGPYEGCVFTL